MEAAQQIQPQKKMGKFRASYLLAVESFELLRKDKEVIWYVILNLLSIILLACVFAGLYFFALASGVATPLTDAELNSEQTPFGMYVVFFLFYIGTAFLTTYFGVALTSVVATRIAGGDKNFKEGLHTASSKAGKIFFWSVLTSTVGIVLNFVGERLGAFGKIFGFVGQVAWNVLTFFMIPVLALEEVSVPEALKRSGKTFRDTWGETIITNFSLGIFFGMLEVLVVLAIILGVVFTVSTPLFAGLVLIVGILVFSVVALLHATLEAIVKVVLYQYAVHGKIADTFTPELIMGALTKKTPAVS
jgi:Family of unknown function (DUF6159)